MTKTKTFKQNIKKKKINGGKTVLQHEMRIRNMTVRIYGETALSVLLAPGLLHISNCSLGTFCLCDILWL